MSHFVSIIHGARYFHEKKGLVPSWTNTFKKYLDSQDSIESEIFYWDGGIRNGLSKNLARKYANHILRLHESSNQNVKKIGISIFAKSMGGIIAEHALKLIHQDGIEIKINTFIRIAVPDLRKFISTNQRCASFNITSSSDNYRLVTALPLTIIIFFYLGLNSKKNIPKNIKVENLGHKGFNSNGEVEVVGFDKPKNLFDYYLELMT